MSRKQLAFGILVLICIGLWGFYGGHDALATQPPPASTFEQRIEKLEAENIRLQGEIEALSQSHQMAIGVNQDLDLRLSRIEGRW